MMIVLTDVPIFVSKPRFLDADPVYLENVTCPKPNASKHDSYLCIEPVLKVWYYL